ncbi:Alpha/Beta hydrolase protein, partial [Thamnidium elegans]
MLKTVIKITGALVAIYAAIIAILSFDTPQRCLMFLHWVKFPLHPQYEALETFGFGHNAGRNIKIQTSDNVTLGAWHFLPSKYYEKLQLRTETNVPEQVYDNALGDSQYDTIIYFHGNALDRTAPWRIDLYKHILNRFGKVNIITIDYRGFGDSESTPSESGLRLDAQATLSWLNYRNVPNSRIILIGHSLGTGVATTLAYDMTLSDNPAKGLILKAGYSSMATLIFEYNVVPYFPILSPLKRIPELEQWLLSKLNHKFDSLSKIEHVTCPLLIIYGATDMEIPIQNSHRLFVRAVSRTNSSSIEELQASNRITRTVIPNEAIVYSSKSPKVTMIELVTAHHNNVGYFDFTYQSMKDMLGITE